MSVLTKVLLFVLLTATSLRISDAFLTSNNIQTYASFLGGDVSHRTSTAAIAIFRAAGNSNDQSENDEGGQGNGDDDSIDLDFERKRLESLLGGGDSSTSSSASNSTITAKTTSSSPDLLSLPILEWQQHIRGQKPPMLTSITRERMELELTLLESLAVSDDAIPEMWNLWYNARGPIAEKELKKSETLVAKGTPDAWNEAQDILRQLISNEGIHFVEPINRLATLMYLQNRYKESEELCKLVLQLKPWHFGALSGMVMVQQGLQNQQGMLDYAKQRMPPLPKKGEEQLKEPPPPELGRLETRDEWVDRMLDIARSKLLRLEMDLDEAFMDLDKGKEEIVELDEKSSNSKNEEINKITSEKSSTNNNAPNDDEDEVLEESESNEITDEDDAWQ